MAEINFGLGLAVGFQSGFGTINATVQGLAGALTLTDGIVLGEASAGVGESGIDLAFLREQRDVAPIVSSFTKQFPTFLNRRVDRFTVAVQLKGSGTIALSGLAANPPVDADMNLANNYEGLDALLRAAGLAGAAWGSGVGHQYVPAAVQPLTAKVWSGSGSNAVAYVLMDCVVSTLSIVFTPGDVAIATFEIAGTVVSHTGGVTMPTFAFGHVATISAPTVVNVGHVYGIGGAPRDFSELELTIENDVEDVPASNSTTGFRSRQTGRRIGATATILADTGNDDYEDDRLIATSAIVDDLSFTVGLAATAGSEVKAYFVSLNNPNLVRKEETKVGGAKALALTLEATALSANAEFELRFV